MAEGDPRVLFVMNLVLSSIFATVVIWGLDFIDVVALTPWNVASLALLVMALTYVVTR
ncbi:hypothetical protein ACFR97_01870 [Haloplanus litoreus]|uniref:DUF8107 domain-containing protein n=1 Tax=Haloplanus litoreus TaxID=767515 RepID=A0ABD5ZV80_9EURY